MANYKAGHGESKVKAKLKRALKSAVASGSLQQIGRGGGTSVRFRVAKPAAQQILPLADQRARARTPPPAAAVMDEEPTSPYGMSTPEKKVEREQQASPLLAAGARSRTALNLIFSLSNPPGPYQGHTLS